MLPEYSVYIIVVSDILILLFIFSYVFSLRKREKQLKEKENAIDNSYHHVVDTALSKERKILDDASVEASQIITGAQYLTHSSQEEVDRAVKGLVADIEKEGKRIAQEFTTDYTATLKHMTTDSLTQFQSIMTTLQTSLQKQIADFHNSLLPEVEKELAAYKQERKKEIDQIVMQIVQKASLEIFNRSISLHDHEAMIVDSLERAKKEGVFD